MNNTLTDKFGRVIKSLRISITKKCNLKCIYCHQEGEKHAPEKEISVETIARIVTAATEFGVDKVKFSGGEPLMRDDFEEIIAAASGFKKHISHYERRDAFTSRSIPCRQRS